MSVSDIVIAVASWPYFCENFREDDRSLDAMRDLKVGWT